MVEAIAKIGRAMQVATIAEKVRERRGARRAQEIGVDYIQGFHLAEPCAIDEVFGGLRILGAFSAACRDPVNVEPAFSLGLEEEYLLVDLATRDLVSDPPAELLQRCIAETDGRVSPEFLRSQLEVKTSVCGSVAAMRRELGALRRKVCEDRGELRHRADRGVHASLRAPNRRRTPTTSVTRTSRAKCRAARAAWSSAACTCTSAWTTTSCASTS